MRFRVSPAAQRDLDEIFVYWAERASPQITDQLIDRIVDRFWLLSQFPRAGKYASDIAPEIRCFPAGQYLVYYRISRRTVDIIHIFHGGRNQDRAFKTTKKRT
jgi:toxin ParE1/3/4